MGRGSGGMTRVHDVYDVITGERQLRCMLARRSVASEPESESEQHIRAKG